jgi:hypothetical protein
VFFVELVIAGVVALFFSAILVFLLGWERPGASGGAWPTFIFLFFVLLAATWVGGIWITPFGSVIWHAYWLPFVMVGLVLALLLLAVLPPRGMRRRTEAQERAEQEQQAVGLMGGFFWLLLLAFAVVIAAHYVT